MPHSLDRCASASVALLAVLLFVGCGSEDPSEAAEVDEESLYFEPVGHGRRASLTDTVEIAIRSWEMWNVYRDSLDSVAPFDSVDFTQAIVLLAALPQANSGYAVEFRSVDVLDTLVVAEYVVEVPSDDCLVASALTVPFQAVLVRRTDLPVEFRHAEEEYRCTFGPRRRR